MKKITLLLFIGCLAYTTQAQENAAIKPFKDFCKQCEDGTKDYYQSNCRGVQSISDLLQVTEDVGIEKTDTKIEKVAFGYKNTGELRYGVTAKVEILNKKGEVLFDTNLGSMYYLDDNGNLKKIISTQMERFADRTLEKNESVLFVFEPGFDIPADTSKLTVRTTSYYIDIATRTLVEVETLEEKIKL